MNFFLEKNFFFLEKIIFDEFFSQMSKVTSFTINELMIWEQEDYYIRTHEGREDEIVKSLHIFYDDIEFMMSWSLVFEVCQHWVSMENYAALISTLVSSMM